MNIIIHHINHSNYNFHNHFPPYNCNNDPVNSFCPVTPYLASWIFVNIGAGMAHYLTARKAKALSGGLQHNTCL